jgi:DHA1 family inner membrane transport protein
MTTTPQHRPATILGVLFAGAFMMGCAEMLVVGLIDLIAADLSVGVPAAGALVTANAVGLAVGGPVLAFLTTRYDRRKVLLLALAAFVLLNALPAFGAGYAPVLVARVLAGAAQGLFIAAAMVTATSAVPAHRAGRAMAVVITGFASASALGLPLGTLLGQVAGWRGSFVAVVALSSLLLVVAAVVLPSVPTPEGSRAVGQARSAFAPRVLAVLGVGALVFTGIQSAVTYIVPFLAQATGIGGPAVGAYLLVYGVATTAGSFVGGRFADTNASRTLVLGAAGVAASLLVLLLFGAGPVPAAIAVAGIGFCGMATGPSLQHRTVGLAGAGAPLAASLPASAVNAGIAAGAFAGGAALDLGGVTASVASGLAFSVVAILAAWGTGRLRPVTADSPVAGSRPGDRRPDGRPSRPAVENRNPRR